MRRPIWGYSVCTEKFHKNVIKKIKITPNTPKNDSGLIQLIMMGESIRQIWVKDSHKKKQLKTLFRQVDVKVDLSFSRCINKKVIARHINCKVHVNTLIHIS